MFNRLKLASAFGLALIGAPAFAEVHEITLVEGGFFPEIVYLSAGDKVNFTNQTDATAEIEAIDESWNTGSINVNASYLLDVDATTTLAFTFADDVEKAGSLTFAPAPLQ